jgi:hypothetical protein
MQREGYSAADQTYLDSRMNQTRKRGPLVILAFDSGDAGLIEQWAEEGYLPTIKGLLERGVQSRLTGSEFVSENGIWVSLFSGLSRAQHGYYYWRPLKPGTYELELSDQRVENAVPFWGHLHESRMRVAVIDVPETHCVAGVPGVQVANWAPHNARFAGYSVPSSLFADLRRQFGSPLGVEERVGRTVVEADQTESGHQSVPALSRSVRSGRPRISRITHRRAPILEIHRSLQHAGVR